MAKISITEGQVELHLSVLEEIGSFHGSIRVPLSAVAGARVVDDPFGEVRGIRAPGTGFPGVIALGTFIGSFGRDFYAIEKKGPAVVIELEGQRYQRLIASQENPQEVVTALGF
jgi:hypothetical protein